jgi:hypothetical protein
MLYLGAPYELVLRPSLIDIIINEKTLSDYLLNLITHDPPYFYERNSFALQAQKPDIDNKLFATKKRSAFLNLTVCISNVIYWI